MKLDFAVIADHAYLDDRQRFFILGEFRYVFVLKVPALQQRMALAMRLRANRAEVRGAPSKLQIELTDGDGNPVLPRSPEVPVHWLEMGPASPAELLAQVVAELQGVPLPKVGDYSFQVFVNNQHLGSAQFNVQLRAQPQRP